jgi:hypothetical protein
MNFTHHPILAADSAINFQRARKWLDKCISEHHQCRKTIAGTEANDNASRPLLPRRVISIGLEDTGTPHLLVSHGKAGKYIALSYCVRMLFLGSLSFAPRHILLTLALFFLLVQFVSLFHS